jgi:DNA adenine methylase
VHLSDAHEDLALLWRAMVQGWVPPHHLTREEWEELKREGSPSALRGFAGYGASFGGAWFKSYAADNIATGNHYACASSRSLQRKAAKFAHAQIRHADYTEAGVHAGPDTVIYCDPPYAGTYPYKAVGRFDNDSFWRTARRWSEAGALVLVSEYTAPEGWTPVWSAEIPTTMNQGVSAGTATEQLFLMEPS